MHLIEYVIKEQGGVKLNNSLLAKLINRIQHFIEERLETNEEEVKGGFHVWYFIVRGMYEKQYDGIFLELYNRYLKIFLDTKIINDDVVNWMSYFIQNGGIKTAAPFSPKIISKSIYILENFSDFNEDTINAVWYLLFLLARMLYKISDIIFKPFGKTVLNNLAKFAKSWNSHKNEFPTKISPDKYNK